MSELTLSPELLQISAEVQDALKNKKPVVALESTIISHGMPFPQNAQTAIEVEETIRKQGAVPLTNKKNLEKGAPPQPLSPLLAV